ncbi:TetR/AcrR family transcriptional regulator [Hazenella coriacea]|uniref:TetR family transcriptional regulator n=1 Tax=Hazenella coriacea TaxID=1179467 RepID=A0A4R3L4M2_9BACL|nr:TetR/AcrR family transcriptional regulator [Hazenella coriacea]TCS93928.1 TetR family transcriptional regulator [Hazenella coriacea]
MKYKTGEDTKEKIINVAFFMIAKHGYEATSINRIMNEIGRTKGTFYAHFKSKEELFFEIMNRRMAFHLKEAKQKLEDQVSNKTFHIRTFIQDLIRLALDEPKNRKEWQAIYLELLTYVHRNERIKWQIQSSFEKWRKLLILAIDQAKELGQIKPEVDSNIFATSILALFDGYGNQQHVNPTMNTYEQIKIFDWFLT